MKIEIFKKLEQKIKDQDFYYSYKNINIVMFVLSIFGHISSIFLAFFLVSKVILGAVEGNTYVAYGASIIMLIGLELLKREIFDKFSLQQIKLKNIFNKDVVPLFIVSLVIVSMSFYASIKGAEEFSNRSEKITSNTINKEKSISDSLDMVYDTKTKTINVRIDKLQSNIDANLMVLSSNPKRKDLSKINNDLTKQINLAKEEKNALLSERDSLVKRELAFVKNNSTNTIAGNEKNSNMFVIISIIIELTILFGVYFNEYYKWRSYSDFKVKIDNDPLYNKWLKCNSVLGLLYNQETKINDKSPSVKTILDMCKINNIFILNKELQDVMKLFNSIGITRVVGNARYILKNKEQAEEALKSHFNIR
jgi:hypothetical protein